MGWAITSKLAPKVTVSAVISDHISSYFVFSPNSIYQNDFIKKDGWYTFFLLYLLAKYEFIWSDITAQTITLGANLLVMAQTIPQNAHRVFFLKLKVVFSEDI